MFSKSKSEGGRKRKVAPTIISSDMRITGNVTSEGEVQVDGVVDGDVRGGNVSIGSSGHIAGAVTADKILVRGRINGQIRAQIVTFTRTAQVKGDVFHDTLSVEAGAKLEVRRGQRVKFGQRIGQVGTSGRSTGPHVHYEILLNGRQIDPLKFIKAGKDVFKE